MESCGPPVCGLGWHLCRTTRRDNSCFKLHAVSRRSWSSSLLWPPRSPPAHRPGRDVLRVPESRADHDNRRASSGVTVTGDSAPRRRSPSPIPSTGQADRADAGPGQGCRGCGGRHPGRQLRGRDLGHKKVFDSSFSRGEPAGFVIGKGRVIPGWDKTLVGQKLGSRVLLTIPPADGYGASGNSQAGISGTDTLVFVVDLIAVYKPDASAPGTPAGPLPAGWPKVSDTPPRSPPSRASPGSRRRPSLSRSCSSRARATRSTRRRLWCCSSCKPISPPARRRRPPGARRRRWSVGRRCCHWRALTGQRIGARAVVLLPGDSGHPRLGSSPAQPASPAAVLVIDVVGSSEATLRNTCQVYDIDIAECRTPYTVLR